MYETKNMVVTLLSKDIHYIKDAIEKRSDKVDDKLKALAKILDDDDNPVLEIVKFK
jgi:propanediol dehydratase large subunit